MTQVKDRDAIGNFSLDTEETLFSNKAKTAQAPSFTTRKIQLSARRPDASVEILFLGDTGFGENYPQRLEESGHDNILKSEGYDYPLAKMKALLSDADLIVSLGAGKNQEEANEPFIIEASLGDQSFSCAIISAFQDSSHYGREDQGGINCLNLDAIIKNIRSIKANNPETDVIILPYWGANDEWKSAQQANIAQVLIENGADLILGHGAHMLQEIEQREGKWVAYSLGDFMFNSPGRYEQYSAPPYSLVAKLIVRPGHDKLTISCRLYPIITNNKQTLYQSAYVTEYEFDEVCQLLTEKNTSKSTYFHTLTRSKDEHGYYLELPISNDKHATEAALKNRIGLICNTRTGVIPGKMAKKWMFRAVSMNEALKKVGIELFIYAYNGIDTETGTVSGYVIENNQFVKKVAPVPLSNYDWFLGTKSNSINTMSYAQFSAWAAKRHIEIFPHISYIALSKDKFLSYKTISEFSPDIAIYTELYTGDISQLERLIRKNGMLFIKPQFGSSGNGIIVIKRLNDAYTLNYYNNTQKTSLSFDTLSSARAEANKLTGQEAYIIQHGITTARIDSSTFDIRIVVIGEQNAWDIIPEVRLGKKESDLSNISQGGSCLGIDDLLAYFSEKMDTKSFKAMIYDLTTRLTSFLDAFFPSKLFEMSYDIILDSNNKIYITEINCKPGSPMISRDFQDMFNMTDAEKVLYENHMKPHGKLLALNMQKRLVESMNKSPKIWFDWLSPPLAINSADKAKIMHELYSALNEKRSLLKENLPASLISDRSPRIAFLSISNGFSKAQVAMASGYGLIAAIKLAMKKLPLLHKEGYKPIWLKLDIVTESTTQYNTDLNTVLNFDWSLKGVAFSKESDIAFLPEQLNASLLVTNEGKLNQRKISQYLAANPYLSERAQKLKNQEHSSLYEFSTDSLFYDGSNLLPLFRGHRLYSQVTENEVLSSVDSAIDYLIRSMDLNGRFSYSYESKVDDTDSKYNILHHAGALNSMLQAYAQTRDEKIMTAVQRGLRYLIQHFHEVLIHDEKTLVVMEKDIIKLGANAQAVLTLAKFIQVTHDTSYLPLLQKLGSWIMKSQNSQGEFLHDIETTKASINYYFEPKYYPGDAILALTRIYEIDPQPHWFECALKGALFIVNIRDAALPNSQLNQYYDLLSALSELHRLKPNEALLTHSMKIATALIENQRKESHILDWIGSYYSPPRSTPVAIRMAALSSSYHLAHEAGLHEQAEKILAAIKLGVNFQLQTQFNPETAMYCPNPQRVLGGFHRTLTDFEIRIDYVYHNIASLLGFHTILQLHSQPHTPQTTRSEQETYQQ